MINDEKREEIRKYLERLFGQKVESSIITSITVNPPYYGQNKRTIQIDNVYSDLEPDQPPEKVLAIFESKSFLVCTADRGTRYGRIVLTCPIGYAVLAMWCCARPASNTSSGS